jgi:hypothetical protein
MRNFKSASLLLLLSVAACTGGGSSSSPDTAQAPNNPSWTGEGQHPIYGNLSTNQKVLLGADINGNGVRDDVDEYIAAQFADTPVMSKAVTSYAQIATNGLLYPDQVLSADESSKKLAAYFCAANEMDRVNSTDADNWNSLVIAKTMNTEERMRAWYTWDSAQNTITEIDLEADPCAKAGL